MTSPSALKKLFATCVLTALIFSTVEGYNCKSCLAYTCQTGNQTCETSQGCFNHREEWMNSGQLTENFDMKGCSSSKCTPLSFSASLGNNIGYVYERKCCQSELCNQEELKVPQKSSKPNGITCPACYSEQSASCDPVPLACTGAETKCVKVVASAGFKSAMGCATESACNLKNVMVLYYPNITTTCESSGAPPLTSITSSILIGLFLFKVLL